MPINGAACLRYSTLQVLPCHFLYWGILLLERVMLNLIFLWAHVHDKLPECNFWDPIELAGAINIVK